MPKRFYSERDIEELVKGGGDSLEINDDVVLTELAYEKARQLGLKLTRDIAAPPSAPVRPYISRPIGTSSVPAAGVPSAPPKTGLEDRIRSSVLAKMGDQIDPVLLDSIVSRVVKNVGVK